MSRDCYSLSGRNHWALLCIKISELLALNGQRACEQTREFTELKLADVRRRLEQLQQLEQTLARLVADCRLADAGACCPTLHLLEKEIH